MLNGFFAWWCVIVSFGLQTPVFAQTQNCSVAPDSAFASGQIVRHSQDNGINSSLGNSIVQESNVNDDSLIEIHEGTEQENDRPRSNNNNNSNNKSDTFLSFGEWKKIKEKDMIRNSRNENIKKHREHIDPSCLGDRDCIGEEMEIDFDVFSSKNGNRIDDGELEDQNEPEGRIYKDKFNFASLDCAATIVKTNSEASGATSILIENKDKYLLNPCSAANKFVVIELCEDILVEEIILANFEYFSSNFKLVRISVSDRYPVPRNGWTVLGEYEGNNSRDLQKFEIKNPQIWAKYLRIEILSHYGEEFYCPLSLVRAHGKTMIDEFKSVAMEESEKVSDDISNEGSIEENVDTEEKKEDLDAPIIMKQEYEDEEIPLKQDYIMESDLLDESSWPYFGKENKTLVPQLPDPMHWCESRLEPLRFEEFLRELDSTLYKVNETGSSNELTSSDSISGNITLQAISSNSTNGSNVNISNGRPPLSHSPSPEESIFKNIMKRISILESNATLTVLYVEEQSKLLSKSFTELEKTYLDRFDGLVTTFNETVMNNIDLLKLFAIQLKEQSLHILDDQKKNNENFNFENQLRIQKLEEEIKTQRRLIIICICLAIFSLYHNVLNRLIYIEDDELTEAEKLHFSKNSIGGEEIHPKDSLDETYPSFDNTE